MIAIYYCSSIDGVELRSHVEFIEDGPQQISEMLERMRYLHKAGFVFITSTSHTRDGIVQGVIDGKLPNGEPYTWKKRRP